MKMKTLLWALLLSPIAACYYCSDQKPCDHDVQYPNPGACADNTLPTGAPGGPCGVNSCGAHLLCNPGSECYSGTCIPCGHPGEVCCNIGEFMCDKSTCAPTPDDDGFKHCTADCGLVGLPCCPDNSCGPDTGGCDPSINVCQPAPDPSCAIDLSKPQQVILVRDAYGCGDVVVFNADTYDQAVKCLEPALNEKGSTVLPPYQPLLTCTEVNSGGVNPDNVLTLTAFSETDAHSCAQAMCNNNCTTTDKGCL